MIWFTFDSSEHCHGDRSTQVKFTPHFLSDSNIKLLTKQDVRSQTSYLLLWLLRWQTQLKTQVIGVKLRLVWDVIDLEWMYFWGIDTVSILSPFYSAPQCPDSSRKRWWRKKGQFGRCAQYPVFINSRLIFHTCAVLGDISSYTRQARIHRLLHSFPKTEERKRERERRRRKSGFLI